MTLKINTQAYHPLFQLLLSEGRQNEAGLVNLRVVVTALLSLLLRRPAPQRHLDIAAGVLAAHHEADLTGGVGGDSGVSVLGNREDLLAVLLQAGDEGEVKPLVLS